jgi:hypothetical protein
MNVYRSAKAEEVEAVFRKQCDMVRESAVDQRLLVQDVPHFLPQVPPDLLRNYVLTMSADAEAFLLMRNQVKLVNVPVVLGTSLTFACELPVCQVLGGVFHRRLHSWDW